MKKKNKNKTKNVYMKLTIKNNFKKILFKKKN